MTSIDILKLKAYRGNEKIDHIAGENFLLRVVPRQTLLLLVVRDWTCEKHESVFGAPCNLHLNK